MTDNPKASATPRRPIGAADSGKAALMTALPHPANTNQNVPKNSAIIRRLKDIGPPFSDFSAIQDLELILTELDDAL